MSKQMIRKFLAVAICICVSGCSGSNTSGTQQGIVEEGKEEELISIDEASKIALKQYGNTAFVKDISLQGYIYTAKVLEEQYEYTVQIDGRTKVILAVETNVQS